jgi:hypothetical protein
VPTRTTLNGSSKGFERVRANAAADEAPPVTFVTRRKKGEDQIEGGCVGGAQSRRLVASRGTSALRLSHKDTYNQCYSGTVQYCTVPTCTGNWCLTSCNACTVLSGACQLCPTRPDVMQGSSGSLVLHCQLKLRLRHCTVCDPNLRLKSCWKIVSRQTHRHSYPVPNPHVP